jgi:hypothetical protein
MKNTKLISSTSILFTLSLAATLCANAQNAVVEFTNLGGDSSYTDSLNWDSFSVPDLNSPGTTAQIADGSDVTLTGGQVPVSGDLNIANGSELEITDGSFTQTNSGAYIDLGRSYPSNTSTPMANGTGGGTILIDGGTFNQGTDGAGPFDVNGTGNTFEITAGAANITSGFTIESGLAYVQSGGAVTVGGGFNINQANSSFTMSGGTVSSKGNLNLSQGATYSQSGGTNTINGNFILSGTSTFLLSGGTLSLGATNEFDFNNMLASQTGGILNVNDITGFNATANGTATVGVYSLSGGIINNSATSAAFASYGANSTKYINFTLASTADINFTGGLQLADVEGLVTDGGIEFNNTDLTGAFAQVGTGATDGDFFITETGTTGTGSGLVYTLSLSPAVVPEPSTYLMLGLGLVALVGFRRRLSKV